MIFEQIDAGGDRNFSYLIGDEASGTCNADGCCGLRWPRWQPSPSENCPSMVCVRRLLQPVRWI